MSEVKKVQIKIGNEVMTLETGRIAKQANGAVFATYGITAERSITTGQNILSLQVVNMKIETAIPRREKISWIRVYTFPFPARRTAPSEKAI